MVTQAGVPHLPQPYWTEMVGLCGHVSACMEVDMMCEQPYENRGSIKENMILVVGVGGSHKKWQREETLVTSDHEDKPSCSSFASTTVLDILGGNLKVKTPLHTIEPSGHIRE
jgi:hypothetical protein